VYFMDLGMLKLLIAVLFGKLLFERLDNDLSGKIIIKLSSKNGQ
jgi:hypothetical protein